MVNFVAIVIAAVVSFVLGMIWFGPLFGKTWMKLTGVSEKDAAKGKKGDNMPMLLVAQFVTALVTAYVLSMFVGFVGAKDAMSGAMVGFWAWLGFLATTSLGMVLWEGKPMELYLLKNGHMFVELLLMGAILAVMV
ncbi:MAG: DUF1761 domain-containing protein [Candidatus Micrarchaeota archaeon]|nr:DUF1761 domain-containing protein [Candidatus Micrarchaeota archaeon]